MISIFGHFNQCGLREYSMRTNYVAGVNAHVMSSLKQTPPTFDRWTRHYVCMDLSRRRRHTIKTTDCSRSSSSSMRVEWKELGESESFRVSRQRGNVYRIDRHLPHNAPPSSFLVVFYYCCCQMCFFLLDDAHRLKQLQSTWIIIVDDSMMHLQRIHRNDLTMYVVYLNSNIIFGVYRICVQSILVYDDWIYSRISMMHRCVQFVEVLDLNIIHRIRFYFGKKS